MKMTAREHRENAEDWIACSQGITDGEHVDREQLAGQFLYTIADADDIEAIAREIESICQKGNKNVHNRNME